MADFRLEADNMMELARVFAELVRMLGLTHEVDPATTDKLPEATEDNPSRASSELEQSENLFSFEE